MNLHNKISVVLVFLLWVKNITSTLINSYKFESCIELATDPLSTTTYSPLFTFGNMSAMQCVRDCVSTQNCDSILHSTSLCSGYPVELSSTSANLVPMPGAQCYRCVEFTVVNTQNTGSNVTLETCSALGYIWNDTLGICFKVHTTKAGAPEARAVCNSEDPNSRLLLIDSEEMFNFAVDVIESYNTGVIYLQGTFYCSKFRSDDGPEITYSNWKPGEPPADLKTARYLRTNSNTHLIATSKGTFKYKFVCRLY